MISFTKFGRVKRNHILSQNGKNFLKAPWAGGIVLIVCVVIFLILKRKKVIYMKMMKLFRGAYALQ